jgi:ankyrin repeat protein
MRRSIVLAVAAATVFSGCSDTDRPDDSRAGSSAGPESTTTTPSVVPTPSATPVHVAHPDAALLSAAHTGDAALASRALASGADADARDEHRRTPLLLAVTHDRLEVARVLVAAGADPDALDDRHDTPWLVTGVTGSVAMAELLLTVDPDLTIRNRYGGLSIIPASERGHVGYVRRVARTDIDLDHVNDLGWTALLEAVILGRGTHRWQQVVTILLAHGADPGIPDGDGVTALQHAERDGYDEIADLLRAANGKAQRVE